jgi:hypothetical protein
MKEIMQSESVEGFPGPASRLVRKGRSFEFFLCGLLPPVLSKPTMASPLYFLSLNE